MLIITFHLDRQIEFLEALLSAAKIDKERQLNFIKPLLAADATEEKIDALVHNVDKLNLGMIDSYGFKTVAQDWGSFILNCQ